MSLKSNFGKVAVSISQPWASLICLGYLSYGSFTLPWNTLYRGELFIHSKTKFTKFNRELAKKTTFCNSWMDQSLKSVDELETGSIIGRVTLLQCCPAEGADATSIDSSWGGNFTKDHWIWYFTEEILFKEAVKIIGRLGLFYLSPKTFSQISKNFF